MAADRPTSARMIESGFSVNDYTIVFDSFAEDVLVCNPSGVVIRANASAQAHFGFDPADMRLSDLEKKAFSGNDGQTGVRLSHIFTQSLDEHNSPIETTAEYVDTHGAKQTVSCIATALRAGETFVCLIILRRKLAGQTQPEAQSLVERNRLVHILDSIEDGIYICSDKFEVEYANPALLARFGDPGGKRCFEYLYKRDSHCPWCRGEEVFNGKTIHSEWQDPDTERVYDVVDTPLENPDGTISKIKIFHDITDSKATEKHLVKSAHVLENKVEKINTELEKTNSLLVEKLADLKIRDRQLRSQSEVLEKIFTNTHFLMAFLDTDFTFIRVNNAWSGADGRPVDFFPGAHYFELYPDTENERIFTQVRDGRNPFIAFAKSFSIGKSSRPEPSYWDWSLQPVINDRDLTEGLILTLIDVTVRTKAEKELMEAEAALAEAKRLSDIGVLAATVAHELRNPLGVIQAAIYNIRKKTHDGNLDAHIANIEKKIGESERIINNLLNYSNIKLPKIKQIHLYYFITECLESLEEQYRDYSVSMQKEFEEFMDVLIEIDPFQIREVLINVLNNAYQALTDKEGTIRIEGKLVSPNRVSIRISDNGEGIDSEDLEKVFVPFFTRKSKGTGLGLTICRDLVKLHNGEIGLSSVKGKGTSVLISLPVRCKHRPQLTDPSIAPL